VNAISSKTFKSGNSEAVRLPKDLGFGIGVDIVIARKGDVVTISRKRPSIKDMIKRLREIPAPSGIEVRDPDIFPEREGL
jgi:antitoxin VapB